MAIIVTKEYPETPKSGFIRLYISQQNHLSSIDDTGTIRTFSEGIVGTYKSEPFNLSNLQLQNKAIEFEHQPIPGSIRFRIKGCLDQIEDEGFYVDGKYIRWDNYGLDGFLNQNDLIQIIYNYVM